MKKNVKMVLVTNEKIKEPDFKFIHNGEKYNVSVKNRTMPMVEAPDIVEKIAECLMLQKK
jgi:hypothetical protein